VGPPESPQTPRKLLEHSDFADFTQRAWFFPDEHPTSHLSTGSLVPNEQPDS
jgi:hypothetical protein